MRKITKITIAAFCAGVLLSGIGAGIAVAEYTSLEYTGEHILGQESIKTEDFDITVTTEEGKKIQLTNFHGYSKISYDDTIPENTIRVKATYNPDLVSLSLNYSEYDPESYSEDVIKKYQGYIRLERHYTGSEYDLFMKNKDKILGELKNNRCGSYRTESIQKLEIQVNPQLQKYVSY